MKYKNNPLNIRYRECNNWQGQLSPKKGFCQFVSPYSGYRAAVILLNRYKKHGACTIRQIVSRWAPPSENNTDNYVSFVVSWMNDRVSVMFDFMNGVLYSEDSVISYREDAILLLFAMTVFEQGFYDSSMLNVLELAVVNNFVSDEV